LDCFLLKKKKTSYITQKTGCQKHTKGQKTTPPKKKQKKKKKNTKQNKKKGATKQQNKITH